MTNNKKSKRSQRKSSANRQLAGLFKMSREQLAVYRRTSGGGIHRTRRDTPRGVQKRRAIKDQV